MAKNENPETPEINRKLSKSKKHPLLTAYHYQKTAKKLPVVYLSTLLAFITKKAAFKLRWQVLFDDFEQRFESRVLNTQNA